MQTSKPRVRADILSDALQEECVLYDNDNKKVHLLNAAMCWLWSHCDGTRTVDDLIADIANDMGEGNAHHVIMSGLSQLADAELLEPGSFDTNALGGQYGAVSRRAAVAAGVSIALPVMSSILAPTPAAAKSHPDKDNESENPPKPAK
jgi:hypothetical protein